MCSWISLSMKYVKLYIKTFHASRSFKLLPRHFLNCLETTLRLHSIRSPTSSMYTFSANKSHAFLPAASNGKCCVLDGHWMTRQKRTEYFGKMTQICLKIKNTSNAPLYTGDYLIINLFPRPFWWKTLIFLRIFLVAGLSGRSFATLDQK